MDCDDILLLLASPSEVRSSKEDALLSKHTSQCESCFELSRQLSEESLKPEDELIGQGIGRYTIRRLIGSGGMGRVYLAVHPEIESRVAIKVFSKDWNAYPKLVARFFAEAHATNLIAHENIVNVLDVGRLEDGRPYMVMEHLPGWPLSRLIGSETLTDANIGQVMLDVLSALAAAHEHQIVHRDLKPDNIFVSPEGRATLLDFGIAKLIPQLIGDSAPTATGTILGTPHYMSPEQATGDRVDTRTDVYAMGIILYECFTGRRPFQGGSLYSLLNQHVNRTPTRPRAIRPDLSEQIEAVILKAMAKEIGDRFSSIADMRVALLACSEIKVGPSGIALQPAPRAKVLRTAETALDRPEREAPQELVRNRSTPRMLIAAGLVGAIGFAIFVTVVPSSRQAELAQAAIDGGRPDPQTPADASSIPDASQSASIDAASSAPSPIRTPIQVPKRRKRGIAPLSMLRSAQASATAQKSDAILFRIHLTGINADGQIELRKGEIEFDFVSPNSAQRVATRGRDIGQCVIRVRYAGSKRPDVRHMTGRCSRYRPLPPPQCTIAKLLGKGRRRTSVVEATLKVSQGKHTAHPFWRIVDGSRSYKLPGC